VSGINGLAELIRSRRSVRNFQPRPVAPETLERLVELAAWAPSAGNRQDWFFTLVTSPAARKAMADCVRRKWDEIIAANREMGSIAEIAKYAARFADFAEAPAVILVSARRAESFQRHMLGDLASTTIGSFTSAAMAAQNLMLVAHALGLGTCCMTGPLAAAEELQRICGLAAKQEPVCLIAVGWPDETPPAPERKPLETIMRTL
jgi:nitroreductase